MVELGLVGVAAAPVVLVGRDAGGGAFGYRWRRADATGAAPAAAAQPSKPRIAPAVKERSPGGVQRYGEAVIRQVLGATFVREEPYEPPTRFA